MLKPDRSLLPKKRHAILEPAVASPKMAQRSNVMLTYSLTPPPTTGLHRADYEDAQANGPPTVDQGGD